MFGVLSATNGIHFKRSVSFPYLCFFDVLVLQYMCTCEKWRTLICSLSSPRFSHTFTAHFKVSLAAWLLISVFVFVRCDIHLTKSHLTLLFLSLCDRSSNFQVIFAAWSKVSYILKLRYLCYMLSNFIIIL